MRHLSLNQGELKMQWIPIFLSILLINAIASEQRPNGLSNNLRVHFGRAASLELTLSGVTFNLNMRFNTRGQMTQAELANDKNIQQLRERGIVLREVDLAHIPKYWELVQTSEDRDTHILASVTSERVAASSGRRYSSGHLATSKVVVYLPKDNIFERHTYGLRLSLTPDYRGRTMSVTPRKHFPGALPNVWGAPMDEHGSLGRTGLWVFKKVLFSPSRAHNATLAESENIITKTPYRDAFPQTRLETITSEIIAEVSQQTDNFDTSMGHIMAITFQAALLRYTSELLPMAIDDLREQNYISDFPLVAQAIQDSMTPLRGCLSRAVLIENGFEARLCASKWSSQTPIIISEKILNAKFSHLSMGEQAPYVLAHYRACLSENYFSQFLNGRNQIVLDQYKQFVENRSAFPAIISCIYSSILSTMAQLQEDIAEARPNVLDHLLGAMDETADYHLMISPHEKAQELAQVRNCLRPLGLSSGKAAGQTPIGQLREMTLQEFEDRLATCLAPMEQRLMTKLLQSLPVHQRPLVAEQFTAAYQKFQEPFLNTLDELRIWTDSDLYNALFTN